MIGFAKAIYRLHLRWEVSVRSRPPDAWMGRFGGGWQWALGFQSAGIGRTTIIHLVTFSVRISPRKRT